MGDARRFSWLRRIGRVVFVLGMIGVACTVLAPAVQAGGPSLAQQEEPIKVKVGAFVSSLYDLNLQDRSYNVVMWMWFLHRSKDYKPYKTTIPVNAKSYKVDHGLDEEVDDLIWSSAQYEAKLIHRWEMANFPFDRQVLQVVLEDAELDVSWLVYEPDVENSRVDSSIVLDDWDIVGFDIQAVPQVYETTYGDPNLVGTSTYSRLIISIVVQRKGARLFFNLMIGSYAAFVAAILALLVPPQALPPRFSMVTAAIFAAVSNKYIVDSRLPPVTSLTLVDKIQFLSFAAIGVSAVVSVLTACWVQSGRAAQADRLNRYTAIATSAVYVLLNGLFILLAARA